MGDLFSKDIMHKWFLKEFPYLCPSGYPPEWSREQPLPSTAAPYSKLISAFRTLPVHDLCSLLTGDLSDNSSEQFLSTTVWLTCIKTYLEGKAMQHIEVWFRIITFLITNICWDDWGENLWCKVHIYLPSNLQLLFQMNSSYCTISANFNTSLNSQWIRGSTFNMNNLEQNFCAVEPSSIISFS